MTKGKSGYLETGERIYHYHVTEGRMAWLIAAATVQVGDVVVLDTSGDTRAIPTTTEGVQGPAWVASFPDSEAVIDHIIPSGTYGWFQGWGRCAKVNLNYAAQPGDWLITSTTSGKARPMGDVLPPSGAFGRALTAGSAPEAFLFSAGGGGGTKQCTYVVDSSGGDYSSVVAAASALGDDAGLIFVKAGTYTEANTVKLGGDDQAIIGEKGAIVYGNHSNAVLSATGKSGLVLQGITFKDKVPKGVDNPVVDLDGCTDFRIIDCDIREAYFRGIDLSDCQRGIIRGCTTASAQAIIGPWPGAEYSIHAASCQHIVIVENIGSDQGSTTIPFIKLDDCKYCTIADNVQRVSGARGIVIEHSHYNTVANNHLRNNTWAGILLSHCSHFNNIIGNTCEANGYEGIECGEANIGNTIAHNVCTLTSSTIYGRGIFMEAQPEEGNTTTLNGAISDTATGATVADGSQLPSVNMLLKIGEEYIYFASRSSNGLSGGVRAEAGTTAASHANSATVTVLGPRDNVIEGNVCNWNKRLGIGLHHAHNCIVADNICINNGNNQDSADAGILLDSLTDCLIQNNRIADTRATPLMWHGIVFSGVNTGVKVLNNYITGAATSAYDVPDAGSTVTFVRLEGGDWKLTPAGGMTVATGTGAIALTAGTSSIMLTAATDIILDHGKTTIWRQGGVDRGWLGSDLTLVDIPLILDAGQQVDFDRDNPRQIYVKAVGDDLYFRDRTAGTHAVSDVVFTTRTLTAGSGLVGGGDLGADRAFHVGAGTGIGLTLNAVYAASPAVIQVGVAASGNVLTFNDVNRTWVPAAQLGGGGGGGVSSVTAGTGLTGGGTGDVTLSAASPCVIWGGGHGSPRIMFYSDASEKYWLEFDSGGAKAFNFRKETATGATTILSIWGSNFNTYPAGRLVVNQVRAAASGLALYDAAGTAGLYVVGGNVGIGDTTPDHKLDVAGNIGLAASGYLNWGDTDGASGYGLYDNAGTLQFKNSGGAWASISAASGAPLDAQYLVLTNNPTLTAERAFTAGTGLKGTDAGANSTYTLQAASPCVIWDGLSQGQNLLTTASGYAWAISGLSSGPGDWRDDLVARLTARSAAQTSLDFYAGDAGTDNEEWFVSWYKRTDWPYFAQMLISAATEAVIYRTKELDTGWTHQFQVHDHLPLEIGYSYIDVNQPLRWDDLDFVSFSEANDEWIFWTDDTPRHWLGETHHAFVKDAGGNITVGTRTSGSPLMLQFRDEYVGAWRSLSDFVLTSRTLTAGSGLVGGGNLAADRAFHVGAGTGIGLTLNAVYAASPTVLWHRNAATPAIIELHPTTAGAARLGYDTTDKRWYIDTEEAQNILHVDAGAVVVTSASYGLWLRGPLRRLSFDTGNDYLQYDTVNNWWDFVVGGVERVVVGGSGISDADQSHYVHFKGNDLVFKDPNSDEKTLTQLAAGDGVTDHGALTGLADDDHTQYHTDARGDARYPPLTRILTAGSYLTGGGTLAADRRFDVNQAIIDHDALTNFMADEHVAHSGVTLTAGNGLTGGGTIAADRTFAVGAGTGIAVTADAIRVASPAVWMSAIPVTNEYLKWDGGKWITGAPAGGGDMLKATYDPNDDGVIADAQIANNLTLPDITYDTNDGQHFNTGKDALAIVLASATRAILSATALYLYTERGLDLTGGGKRVSFDGNTTYLTETLGGFAFIANNIPVMLLEEIGLNLYSGSFFFQDGSTPDILFDANDYISYDKTNNAYAFVIGGITKAVIAASYADIPLLKIHKTIVFCVSSATLTVGTRVAPSVLADAAMTIDKVYAYVQTAPAGTGIIVDVTKNDTTIFTTQGNRPAIATGQNEDESGTPDVTALAKNDRLDIDIDQVGSSVAGGVLTVHVRGKQSCTS